MSGSLINPVMIPGTDIVPESISTSAASYRTTATSISSSADAVLASWSGLSGVYSAPESPQLLAAMDPAGVDAHAVAATLTSAAGLLDELAEAVVAPVNRLKELKQEAEVFVTSVRGGVTVGYYDPDNTMFQEASMSGAVPLTIGEGQGEQTLDWSEHTPSVDRNNELLEQVAAEVARLSAASAECVNGINALRADICIAPQEAVTAEQLTAAEGLPWGEIGKGNRSCSESVGDGAFEFGKGIVGGVVALGGWDIDNGWAHSGDFAGKAWTGLVSGLGALVITVGNPSNIALAYVPEEYVPDWAQGAQTWYRGNLENIVGGIVGTPEQWEEDPVAAGTYAVLSVGTFFIPAVGQAGAAAKVTSSLARAATATQRLATLAGDGTRLANGLTHAGTLFTRLSTAVDGLAGGTSGLRNLNDVATALNDIPDIVPDNLVPVRSAVDSPQVEVNASGLDSNGIRFAEGGAQTSATPSAGGGTTTLTEGGRPTAGSDTPTGGSDTATSSDTATGSGRHEAAGADTGSGAANATRLGLDAGDGWTRGPESSGADVDSAYGRPRGDHGALADQYAPPTNLRDDVRHLVEDPGAPYGRGDNGQPYSREQWEERYVGADNRPIYPGNSGAVPGTRVEYTDATAFRTAYGPVLDRMGGDAGDFLSFPDTPFEHRSLPGSNLDQPYSNFRLTDDLPDGVRIEVSEVSPAFGQPGGGIQVRFIDADGPMPVERLLAEDSPVLERVDRDADETGPGGTDGVETGAGVESRPYLDPSSRPSFRRGVVEEVFENARDPFTGQVTDPNTGEIIEWTAGQPRHAVWDMGHVPSAKYSSMHDRYLAGELSPAEFRDWYNDPSHYRPETPGANRGHRFE